MTAYKQEMSKKSQKPQYIEFELIIN